MVVCLSLKLNPCAGHLNSAFPQGSEPEEQDGNDPESPCLTEGEADFHGQGLGCDLQHAWRLREAGGFPPACFISV